MVGVAVNVTELPEQVGFAPVVMLIETDGVSWVETVKARRVEVTDGVHVPLTVQSYPLAETTL